MNEIENMSQINPIYFMSQLYLGEAWCQDVLQLVGMKSFDDQLIEQAFHTVDGGKQAILAWEVCSRSVTHLSHAIDQFVELVQGLHLSSQFQVKPFSGIFDVVGASWIQDLWIAQNEID